VECAFGELVGRWGILWRKLRCPTNRVGRTFTVCCKLHNLCKPDFTSELRRGDHLGDDDG
jgi:hypothetical protein